MRSRIAARLFDGIQDPTSIARFEILGLLGEGGMGVVYRCRDPKLGREIAVKLLRPKFADAPEQSALMHEARALARLAHPNVVPLFEVGEVDGRVFLAMERVDGPSLRPWLAAAMRPWREIVAVLLETAHGLAAAHAAGIVHRDVKPTNILIGSDGRARVVDFGLARAGEPLGDAADAVSPNSPHASTTRRGRAGTPAYMSPEQVRGGVVDARADQWGFCVTAWEALYGVRPYQPEELDTTRLGEPRRGQDVGPAGLRTTLLRGLCCDPADRWPSMDALVSRLRAVLAASARRPRVVVGTSALACVGLGVWLGLRDTCPRDASDIDAVWGPARRARMLADLERDHGSAQPIAGWLADRLDVQRERWIEANRGLCLARDAAAGESATRTEAAEACLARARDRIAHFVDAAVQDPARVLGRIGTEADGNDELGIVLGIPGDCLESELDASLPAESAVVALAAQADLELVAGDVQIARGLANAALATAFVVEAPRAHARAQETMGRVELASGWTEQGIEHLLEGVKRGEAARMDVEVARMWIALGEAAVTHLHDARRGYEWSERAEAAVARLDDPETLRLEVARLQGVVASMRGDAELAERRLEQALAAALELGSAWAPRVERIMLDQGNHRLTVGAYAEARQRYDEAASLRRARVGDEHPSMAAFEIALGRAARELEEPDRAREHFARAVALLERAYGLESPRLSSPLAGLGDSLLELGDLDAAERVAARTATVQDALPPEHPDRGGGRTLLGMIAELRGDHERAADEFAAAADARRGLADPAQRLEAVNNAAWHLAMVGRAAEARPHYQWLLLHTEAGTMLHVFALAGIGRVLDLEGAHDEAVATLESARDAALRLHEPRADLLAEIDWHLAAALQHTPLGAERARELAARTLRFYRGNLPELRLAIDDLQRLAGEQPQADG